METYEFIFAKIAIGMLRNEITLGQADENPFWVASVVDASEDEVERFVECVRNYRW